MSETSSRESMEKNYKHYMIDIVLEDGEKAWGNKSGELDFGSSNESGYFQSEEEANEVAEKIRKENPKAKVMVNGKLY